MPEFEAVQIGGLSNLVSDEESSQKVTLGCPLRKWAFNFFHDSHDIFHDNARASCDSHLRRAPKLLDLRL
jgi:hypothetical protein